tara:strand:+ start:3300 stop:3599 length:300 start_codon:yes stop_codon:yes gene_type:complete
MQSSNQNVNKLIDNIVNSIVLEKFTKKKPQTLCLKKVQQDYQNATTSSCKQKTVKKKKGKPTKDEIANLLKQFQQQKLNKCKSNQQKRKAVRKKLKEEQ